MPNFKKKTAVCAVFPGGREDIATHAPTNPESSPDTATPVA
jgi:hypothetical protein